MRGIAAAALVFLTVAAAVLGTTVDGVILPFGSNTLRSLHINGSPALGIYSPSEGFMYVGGTSGGITFTDTGATFPALVFEGATEDAYETTVDVYDPSNDVTIRFPEFLGLSVPVDPTVMVSICNGCGTSGNSPEGPGTVWGGYNSLFFEGSTANAHETILTVTDATADRTITFPNSSGTVILEASGLIGLTGTTFASLGASADGTIAYCSDCTKATPCAGSGDGALAKRLNGAWDCD